MPKRNRTAYSFGALLFGVIVLAELRFPDPIFGMRAFKVTTVSMSPNLGLGDRFTVDVKYYRTHRPNRGDVILFRTPTTGVVLVKRVVAVEGNTIKGGSDGTTVDGRLISEPYVLDTTIQSSIDSNSQFGPVTIPSNKLFVMGDNRRESYDSRHFGFVDVNDVIGKALYVYYSSGDKARIGHAVQ